MEATCQGCGALRVLQAQLDALKEEVARERSEHRQDLATLFARVEDISQRVGEVYRVLLVAVLPMAAGLLLAVLGFVLKW